MRKTGIEKYSGIYELSDLELWTLRDELSEFGPEWMIIEFMYDSEHNNEFTSPSVIMYMYDMFGKYVSTIYVTRYYAFDRHKYKLF